ncbi:MAG: hypothetical protein MZV70_70240 [Desulfobacterales bacterium]|nr:hypothetical protein [Desulfobacterales bacterium]
MGNKEGRPMDTGHHALSENPRRRQARPYPYPLEATWPHRSRPRANARRPAQRARGPAWTALYALLRRSPRCCVRSPNMSRRTAGGGGWRRRSSPSS